VVVVAPDCGQLTAQQSLAAEIRSGSPDLKADLQHFIISDFWVYIGVPVSTLLPITKIKIRTANRFIIFKPILYNEHIVVNILAFHNSLEKSC